MLGTFFLVKEPHCVSGITHQPGSGSPPNARASGRTPGWQQIIQMRLLRVRLIFNCVTISPPVVEVIVAYEAILKVLANYNK